MEIRFGVTALLQQSRLKNAQPVHDRCIASRQAAATAAGKRRRRRQATAAVLASHACADCVHNCGRLPVTPCDRFERYRSVVKVNHSAVSKMGYFVGPWGVVNSSYVTAHTQPPLVFTQLGLPFPSFPFFTSPNTREYKPQKGLFSKTLLQPFLPTELQASNRCPDEAGSASQLHAHPRRCCCTCTALIKCSELVAEICRQNVRSRICSVWRSWCFHGT
jgi:hypothetical protein